jgi:hypothetical protein
MLANPKFISNEVLAHLKSVFDIKITTQDTDKVIQQKIGKSEMLDYLIYLNEEGVT